MFSEKQISAYRSVRAPEALRERVFSEDEGKRKTTPSIYRFGALAAALALVIALSLFLTAPSADAILLLNGSQIEESANFFDLSPASETRSVSPLSIPLEVKTAEKAVVRVSKGVLKTEGEEGRESFETKQDLSFFWELSKETDLSECYLEIEEKSGTTRFLLTFDEEDLCYVVKKVH